MALVATTRALLAVLMLAGPGRTADPEVTGPAFRESTGSLLGTSYMKYSSDEENCNR